MVGGNSEGHPTSVVASKTRAVIWCMVVVGSVVGGLSNSVTVVGPSSGCIVGADAAVGLAVSKPQGDNIKQQPRRHGRPHEWERAWSWGWGSVPMCML